MAGVFTHLISDSDVTQAPIFSHLAFVSISWEHLLAMSTLFAYICFISTKLHAVFSLNCAAENHRARTPS